MSRLLLPKVPSVEPLLPQCRASHFVRHDNKVEDRSTASYRIVDLSARRVASNGKMQHKGAALGGGPHLRMCSEADGR